MRITEREYLNVLKIVKSYKSQIESDFNIIDEPIKILTDVVEGDFITPVTVQENNKHLWTVGKKYKVLRVIKRFQSQKPKEEILMSRKLLLEGDTGKCVKIYIHSLKIWRNLTPFGKLTKKWKVIN